MSGASAGYTDGYIMTSRQQELMRRKDLDLHELLELCAKPESIDERVKLVQEYSSVYPELKLFLIVAYFCRGSFSQLNDIGPIEYIPSKVGRGGSVETLKSMWNEVTRLYDSFPSGPRIKRGVAHQLLISIHKDDAEIINQMLQGKFYKKELNEIVVSKAFPKETPQLPKT